jgi:hypothetical protein
VNDIPSGHNLIYLHSEDYDPSEDTIIVYDNTTLKVTHETFQKAVPELEITISEEFRDLGRRKVEEII